MLKREDFQDCTTGRKPPRGAPKVRRPTSKEDCRTHSDRENWRWPSTRVVEYKNALYLVSGNAVEPLAEEIRTVDLIAAVVFDGEASKPIIWPVNSDDDSARDAADEAGKAWRRIVWDGATRKYRAEKPSQNHPDPSWPFANFDEMVAAAFRGRIISDSADAIVGKILAERKNVATS